jgi:uncharacterized protein
MKMNKIIIGSMRLPDRQTAVRVLRKAIDYGFDYIDTAPAYRLQSETENAEAWVGEALNLKDYRDQTMVSIKSATSDGRMGLGEFSPAKGQGIRTAAQFGQVFNQSLSRLGLTVVDYYHLWICHTMEHFEEAFKPNGWYEGFLKEKKAGRVNHLGITTHADPETIVRFLESGYFETVTLPLNVINLTRMAAVKYATEKQIKVIAMNPLGGGFLAADGRLKELALRYLMALENVHILIGFTSEAEVDYAKWIMDSFQANPVNPDDILAEIKEMINTTDPRCTGCGYCEPCPQQIEIGGALAHYNLYKYLHIDAAKERFQKLQWNIRYNLKNCVECGLCEQRCPNRLPVRKLINEARVLLYK